MSILDIEVIQKFIRMCDDGWLQGWHERNGGNLTYRMTEDEVTACKEYYNQQGDWVYMPVSGENLVGEYFITTGSGKYFRNIILDPESNIGIVEINEAGTAWRKVWGLKNGAKPTSEFPAHFLCHSVRKRITEGNNRLVYHAHPTSANVLSFVLPLTAKDYTKALWQAEAECSVVFPMGIGVIPWLIPGSEEIARATAAEMERYPAVVWPQHGMVASGADFDETFGLMHTVEKAADIYVKVLSTGLPIKQSMTDKNIRDIADAFGVQINEEFLDS